MKAVIAAPSQYLLVSLALIAYCLPWLLNPGVSLSYGVYDLAEWTSLHPAVRESSPPLLLTLILRLPLIYVTAIVAFSQLPVLPRAAFVTIIMVALLPPLEFFTQYSGDPNYRQQFALSIVALLVGGIGLSGFLVPWYPAIRIIGSAVVGVTAAWGLEQAYTLMTDYYLPVHIGLGGLLFITLCGCIIIIQIQATRQLLLPRRTSRSQIDAAAS